MGFFNLGKTIEKPNSTTGVSIELLHKLQCKICPLNNQPGIKHLEPNGSINPKCYILGEAPGETENSKGIPFVGKAGRVLRFRIPDEWNKHIRWNNVVRTRPPKNRDPTPTEIEACRPSIQSDILLTQPKSIFGFGNIPLYWATGQSGITNWNGRKLPIKIGDKCFWFFPMLHPSYVMRLRRQGFQPRSTDDYGSDTEFTFAINLKHAFQQIDSLPEPIVHSQEDAQEGVRIVTGEAGDLDRVISFIRSLYAQKYIGFDYETNRLRPYADGAKILTVALSSKDGTLAFPLYHPQSKWSKSDLKLVQKAFEDFLYDAPCKKLVHNLSFEQEWSGYFYGERCIRAGLWGDSIGQAYILDERQRGTNSLDFLCLQYFGLHLKAISNLDREKLEIAPLREVLQYNGIDAKYHRLLYFEQAKELKRLGLQSLYEQHVSRVPTMVLTQLKGAPVDQERVQKFKTEFEETLTNLLVKIIQFDEVKKFKRVVGHDFRPSANQDIMKLLNQLGKFPDTVDEKVLEKIKHPICALILEWKKAAKNLSTYVKPLILGGEDSVTYSDGLIHPILNVSKVSTWRTSSEGPNSQNYPAHGESKVLRSQMKHKFLKCVKFDYAGIQARNVAMESKDKTLVAAFWNKYDIHADWSKRIVKLYPDWIDEGVKQFRLDKNIAKAYRQRAKNELVFPSFFGAQPKNLSRGLGIPEEYTIKLHEQFWTMFPEILNWHKKIKRDYHKNGYVTGLSEFRRHAPVSQTELINSPIQSDESLIVCNAMSRLSEMGEDRFQANFEIHDDLTFWWDKKDIDKNAEIVAKEMTRLSFPWMVIVPIVVEVSVGDDWSSTQEVAKFSSVEIWGHKQNGLSILR